MLIGASALGVGEHAGRIRTAVAGHGSLVSEGLRVSVTANLGVATRGRHESLESLICRADWAIYRAKGSGRNRVEHAILSSSPKAA